MQYTTYIPSMFSTYYKVLLLPHHSPIRGADRMGSSKRIKHCVPKGLKSSNDTNKSDKYWVLIFD